MKWLTNSYLSLNNIGLALPEFFLTLFLENETRVRKFRGCV